MTRVRGEQPLPGATERLLQATNRRLGSEAPRMATYLAVSVTVDTNGQETLRVLYKAADSGRVQVIHLASEKAEDGTLRHLAAALRLGAQYVASEVARDGVLPW